MEELSMWREWLAENVGKSSASRKFVAEAFQIGHVCLPIGTLDTFCSLLQSERDVLASFNELTWVQTAFADLAPSLPNPTAD
eukprot:s271_g25.t1